MARRPAAFSKAFPHRFTLVSTAGALLLASSCSSTEAGDDDDDTTARAAAAPAAMQDGFQQDFDLAGRRFQPTGSNPYLVLEPGYQLVLAHDEDRLTITVLDETKTIDGVSTRVVEEREEEDGKLIEVSRNFFAIDADTKDVFYFGEEVDVYKNGAVSGHPGAWLAGSDGARAGLFVPGSPKIGARYYQEVAPKKALDRAEIVSLTHSLKTPAGEFSNCLRTRESNALHPGEEEFKTCAPGIGLIQDEDLLLVRYGKVGAK
jgi:hypothetical protein